MLLVALCEDVVALFTGELCEGAKGASCAKPSGAVVKAIIRPSKPIKWCDVMSIFTKRSSGVKYAQKFN